MAQPNESTATPQPAIEPAGELSEAWKRVIELVADDFVRRYEPAMRELAK